jgi:acetyl-CoA acyltransferase
MNDVDVIGVGMHSFGKFPEKGLKDLVREASARALVDANVETTQLDAVY